MKNNVIRGINTLLTIILTATQEELTDICNDCPINTLFCDKEEDSDNPYQE